MIPRPRTWPPNYQKVVSRYVQSCIYLPIRALPNLEMKGVLREGGVASLQGRGVKSQGGGVKSQDLEQSPRVVE